MCGGIEIGIGLVIGSFLNVLIWRLNDPKAPRWWQGRSLCPNCKHQISWFDNVPLLSFLILRGQCRYCHKKISWQYPTVELVTSLFFMMTGFNPVMLAIGSIFIVIFFSDLIYGLIPDEMILAGSVAALIFNYQFLIFNLSVGLISAIPFFVLAFFKKMGYGDVKLALLMGLLLGWPKIAVALWAGFIIGGFVAIILLGLRKTKLSATIPLGPFLIMGTIISALWSNQVILWLRF